MSKNEKKSAEIRPWGSYEIVHLKKGLVIKKIIVRPGQRLSYQTHRLRDERWVFVEGTGDVTLNDKAVAVKLGSMIEVLKNSKHRVANTGSENLIFIEVMTGRYDENDIIRLEDDYGRGTSRE